MRAFRSFAPRSINGCGESAVFDTPVATTTAKLSVIMNTTAAGRLAQKASWFTSETVGCRASDALLISGTMGRRRNYLTQLRKLAVIRSCSGQPILAGGRSIRIRPDRCRLLRDAPECRLALSSARHTVGILKRPTGARRSGCLSAASFKADMRAIRDRNEPSGFEFVSTFCAMPSFT
jgi:hypothetical protein